ncbi:MAG: trypsin-like peptidase domain-containing protein, partial [Gemmatimonadota bacterium]
GPALEFHQLAGDAAEEPTATAAAAAGRLSQPKQVVAAVAPPTREPPPRSRPRSRSTTAIIEMATRPMRRTVAASLALAAVVIGLAGFVLWRGARERQADIARIKAWADSITAQAQHTAREFQTEIEGLRQANQQSIAEIERLHRELAQAGSDAGAVSRLRAQLEQAQERQQLITGAGAVDYRTISARNQNAVALVLVEFSETERISGTAFAVDSQGTLVTNKHVLVGENGDKTPRRIAVKFSGSRQWFQGRFIGTAADADIGVLRVVITGGTPRVLGLQRDARSLQRGDPVAIIGYPLGLDLPMEGHGTDVVASPSLTVGTTSKVLSNLVQVDGYGAPGSSGSPIFDHDGRVVAVLYGGVQESNGKIILAVPVSAVTDYLSTLGIPTR